MARPTKRRSGASGRSAAKKKKAPSRKRTSRETAVGKKAPAPAKKAQRAPAKKSAKKTAKKTGERRAAKKAPTKRAPAKKTAKKTGERRAAKKAPTKRAPAKKPPASDEKSSSTSATGRRAAAQPSAKKRAALSAIAERAAGKYDETVPGGTAPDLDDVTRARKMLRELREVVERVGDADAELILGDGTLEALLASVVPDRKRSAKSVYDHLAAHKRRASLLARLRHGINERSAFVEGDAFVSPTRVQWFYDGLTFLEGGRPYEGVVGLYRDDAVRYGLAVIDAEKGQSLGPLGADFVSVDEAKKSFRAANGKPAEGLARLAELESSGAADPTLYASLLGDHPWMFGAQHTSITTHGHADPELPKIVAKRASDGAHDILLIEPPSTALVGKTGKVYASFREVWARAERLRTFVQRQASYLSRELKMKIRDPRFLILAGRGASPEERGILRNELESHHAAVRVVTYDELGELAERTLAFFEPRLSRR